MSTLHGIFESYKSSSKPYKIDREMKSPSRYVLWKPSRDFTRPLEPPSGLKGLLHMLNVTVIPTKLLQDDAHGGIFALKDLVYGWTVAGYG
ncbi:hypothetical protein Tco_0726709 [Tanacetum coccineum]|uniref:Uncharacterized protein n=1 Tax=Tanacetum coccineum TaxID=301880 RepID=A0ABQ4YGB9_9ASTR